VSPCEFLAREVPEGPYPHRDEAMSTNQLMKSFAVYRVGGFVLRSQFVYGVLSGVFGNCRIVRHVSRHVALIGRQRSLGRIKHWAS
jgi:hypothetical protein